jgi:hypothetical protein
MKGKALEDFRVINFYISNYIARISRVEESIASNKYRRSCNLKRRCLVEPWKNVKFMVTVTECGI